MEYESFQERRRQLSDAIGNGIAVIPAAGVHIRNDDVDHAFRQDSDFFFLTGFDEPDAVAVINPNHREEQYVLFVRPRDREMEIWNGYRAGVDGARTEFGADAAYPLSELAGKLREYLLGRDGLFYAMGNSSHDGMVTAALAQARRFHARDGRPVPDSVSDPHAILGQMRNQKSDAEIEELRMACEISVKGHLEAMRFARPGLYEYQVQAALEYVFRVKGSPRVGYGSIVASGRNACILHYVENTRQMEAGDLLLIDAAAEYGYLSSDITRTFPVDGTFTAPQSAVYEVVLAAHQASIQKAAPGGSIKELHETSKRVLTEGLIELGLLPRTLDDSLAMHHYREFFMHGTSHWLGMDVHDAGGYMTPDQTARPLQPSMVFTVEPGLYVDPERASVSFPLLEYDYEAWMERRYLLGTEAARKLETEEKAKAAAVEHPIPAEFRGIGIRIEDDILITADGHENLTAGVPCSAEEIEAICAEPSVLPL
ncbi:MAG: aminopeptidase P N-terminal domain-containing protein [Acidimicrobiia bacterium]